MTTTISSLILAAGESARMGRPKPLLLWRGKSFLEHVSNAARGAGIKQIVVVLGAHAENIEPEILRLGLNCVHNDNWHLGVGTSIRAGVAHLLAKYPDTDAIVIQLADQPRLTMSSLRALLSKKNKGSTSMVASRYGESFGVPALFSKVHFSELLALPNKDGAKSLFFLHSKTLSSIDTSEENEDIDTAEQYARLIQ